MKNNKALLIAFIIASLVLSSFVNGCAYSGSANNGFGAKDTTININNDNENGNEDGHIYFLTASGMESNFEYSGSGFLSEVTTTIAGYIYTDYTPFDDEIREVGGKTRVISHTGIQVAVTGTFETLTGYYMSGESIRIETIEESS